MTNPLPTFSKPQSATMNALCRALTHSSKRTRQHPLSSSFSICYSTKKRQPGTPSPAIKEVVVEDTRSRPRPTEIPFQPKVANSVNLIGVVQSPVQFLSSLDGKCWAGTIISQHQPPSSPLWIPVIFEGDLAHTAACHLKENDNIYIAGHLSVDKLPLPLTSNQGSLQVMVHNLNFVEGSSCGKSQFASHKQELEPNTSVSGKKPLDSSSWEDPVNNPTEWKDFRNDKLNKAVRPKHPNFKHKQELKPNTSVSGKKPFDSSSWEDLVNNPTEWKDFRNDKLNKAVKPKHPDFKHKQDGRALWLNSAPSWILEKLEGFELNGQVGMAKKSPGHKDSQGSGVESWKNLVENPSKWWDNRSDKATSRHPDFRHKDSGEGLWLSRAPDWALQRLPPAKRGKGSASAGSKPQ